MTRIQSLNHLGSNYCHNKSCTLVVPCHFLLSSHHMCTHICTSFDPPTQPPHLFKPTTPHMYALEKDHCSLPASVCPCAQPPQQEQHGSATSPTKCWPHQLKDNNVIIHCCSSNYWQWWVFHPHSSHPISLTVSTWHMTWHPHPWTTYITCKWAPPPTNNNLGLWNNTQDPQVTTAAHKQQPTHLQNGDPVPTNDNAQDSNYPTCGPQQSPTDE